MRDDFRPTVDTKSRDLRARFVSGFTSSLGTGAAILTAAVIAVAALILLAHAGDPEAHWLVCEVAKGCAP